MLLDQPFHYSWRRLGTILGLDVTWKTRCICSITTTQLERNDGNTYITNHTVVSSHHRHCHLGAVLMEEVAQAGKAGFH